MPATRPLALVTTAALAASAAAGGPFFCDDFQDGVIGGGWLPLEGDPGILSIVEQNGRLEFPAAPSGADGADAGLLSIWSLDAQQDFSVQVDYATSLPASGEVGLSFGLVFGGDLPGGEVEDLISLDLGRENGAPFACAGWFIGGIEDGVCGLPTGAGTTMYAWYDAANDVVRVSYVGFGDAAATAVAGLRTSAGVDEVKVYLGAFVTQNAPAVPGSDLTLDDFCILDGLVTPETDGDVNLDGAVDVEDLLLLIGAWGPCTGACPADVNGDGTVDVEDLLLLLGNWS